MGGVTIDGGNKNIPFYVKSNNKTVKFSVANLSPTSTDNITKFGFEQLTTEITPNVDNKRSLFEFQGKWIDNTDATRTAQADLFVADNGNFDSTVTLKGRDVGIGEISPTARLHVKTSDSDSSSYALKVDDSSDNTLLSVRNDNLLSMPSGTANLYIGENSTLNQLPKLRIYGYGQSSTLKYGQISVDDFGRGLLGGDVDGWGVDNGNNFTIRGTNNWIIFPGASRAYLGWSGAQTSSSMLMNLSGSGGSSSNFIFSAGNVNFQHPLNSGLPTIYLHSDDKTLGSNEYIKFQHNGTDGNVYSGYGNLLLEGAEGVKIKGSTSDSSEYALKVDDSSNSSLLSVRNDGQVEFKNKSSAPSNPIEGSIYYNSTDKHFYGYNGTSWVQLDN